MFNEQGHTWYSSTVTASEFVVVVVVIVVVAIYFVFSSRAVQFPITP